MGKYILRRLLQLIPVVLLVSILSFCIVRVAPGDPAEQYREANMTEEEFQAVRDRLGLNDPLPIQYVRWLGTVLQGDFGKSIINHRPVAAQIAEKLPATVLLMGTSFLLSMLVSIPLGLAAGLKQNRLTDHVISLLSYVGISLPAFWFALTLIIVFSLTLGWTPTSGMHTTGVDSALDVAWHLILPSVVLGVGNTATFTRYIRANTITQLGEEYVITARAKGVGGTRILFGHVLKNCLLPVITLAGMHLAGLVTGSFIVESVFGWPGMGTLGMTAINSRDYPLIMGFTMLSCLMLVGGNFLADLLYYAADPRIQATLKGGRN